MINILKFYSSANLWAASLGLMLNWDDESTLFTGCPMFHTVGSMMTGTGAFWNGSAFAFQVSRRSVIGAQILISGKLFRFKFHEGCQLLRHDNVFVYR